MLHPVYLPCTEEQLAKRFVPCARKPTDSQLRKRHLKPYLEVVEGIRTGRAPKSASAQGASGEEKWAKRIENDERLWVAGLFLTMAQDFQRFRPTLAAVLERAFGPRLPIETEIGSAWTWRDLVGHQGRFQFFFEAPVPTPRSYAARLESGGHPGVYAGGLHGNHHGDHPAFSPGEGEERRYPDLYMAEAASVRRSVETVTAVDCVLTGSHGFSLFIEARVLTDITCQSAWDDRRNRIARVVDALLEPPADTGESEDPLRRRRPGRSLYLLLTPRRFQESPASRFYGYKFLDYKHRPELLGLDLPHRNGVDWRSVSRRMGWATWEDFHDLDSALCAWLR